jgi:hypothetical protein
MAASLDVDHSFLSNLDMGEVDDLLSSRSSC